MPHPIQSSVWFLWGRYCHYPSLSGRWTQRLSFRLAFLQKQTLSQALNASARCKVVIPKGTKMKWRWEMGAMMRRCLLWAIETQCSWGIMGDCTICLRVVPSMARVRLDLSSNSWPRWLKISLGSLPSNSLGSTALPCGKWHLLLQLEESRRLLASSCRFLQSGAATCMGIVSAECTQQGLAASATLSTCPGSQWCEVMELQFELGWPNSKCVPLTPMLPTFSLVENSRHIDSAFSGDPF